jgi:hypothetical protein
LPKLNKNFSAKKPHEMQAGLSKNRYPPRQVPAENPEGDAKSKLTTKERLKLAGESKVNI